MTENSKSAMKKKQEQIFNFVDVQYVRVMYRSISNKHEKSEM